MSSVGAESRIWKTLKEIAVRWVGRDKASCRKTKALVENLRRLKKYEGAPKKIVADIAALPPQERAPFVLGMKLAYIKDKGARDMLTTKFALTTQHIALDLRVMDIVHRIAPSFPKKVPGSSEAYLVIECALIEQVCVPLGISPAHFDQLLFKNYDGIKSILGRPSGLGTYTTEALERMLSEIGQELERRRAGSAH